MISPVTGEVSFLDGLSISPHESLNASHLKSALSHKHLPIPGWDQHHLGTHESNHGFFEVRAVSDAQSRIHAVLVAHSHPFYELNTPLDSERRSFHESVISRDIFGQREFTWGEVYCRFNPEQHKDWIVIVFAEGPKVALRTEMIRYLREYDPLSAEQGAAANP